MVIILSLIIVFLVISQQQAEKGKITQEDWKEGGKVIVVMLAVLGFGLLVVYLMETFYFNAR